MSNQNPFNSPSSTNFFENKDLEINKNNFSNSGSISNAENSNCQEIVQDPLDQFKVSSGSGFFGSNNSVFIKPSNGQNKPSGNAF